jgi:hypothetical protein
MTIDGVALETHFERSHGTETATLAETAVFFTQLAQNSPYASWQSFGRSPEGRPMSLLIVSKDKAFTPAQALKLKKPIVLIEGCIHAGETEGNDVCQLLARDILIKNAYSEILDNVVLIFLPVFNVDGFARFSPYHRINQNGPKEMGWRVTATRHNLNRDFVKADTPEMRHWLKMYHSWQPHLFFDCHTTDGQDFQYVLTYNIDTHPEYGGAISQWAKQDLLTFLVPTMSKRNMILAPYADLIDERNPGKGMLGGVWRPMLSNSFATLCNRGGFLIEAHSLKPYDKRVHATLAVILSSLQYVASQPNLLMEAVQKTEQETSRWAGDKNIQVPLQFKTRTDRFDTLTFRGFKTQFHQGSIGTEAYPVYTNQVANTASKYFNEVSASVAVPPPLGYIIPGEWLQVLEVLTAHHIPWVRLQKPVVADFEMYRLENVRYRSNSYEGRQTVTFSAHPIRLKKTFSPGDVYVPLRTPKARLIMYLLEPQSPDALVGWGFFNTIFEDREYFEDYVMEPMAQHMFKSDTALAAVFCQKIKQDSVFARSSRARLNFFYEKTPYVDKEKNLYPIARVISSIE